jgi:hypothetical protein
MFDRSYGMGCLIYYVSFGHWERAALMIEKKLKGHTAAIILDGVKIVKNK